MSPLEIFFWGFGGSAAVEIIAAYDAFDSDLGKLPRRYKEWQFWVVRGLLAVVAGGLAVAYDIQKPIAALYVGAATPVLVKSAIARLASREG